MSHRSRGGAADDSLTLMTGLCAEVLPGAQLQEGSVFPKCVYIKQSPQSFSPQILQAIQQAGPKVGVCENRERERGKYSHNKKAQVLDNLFFLKKPYGDQIGQNSPNNQHKLEKSFS